MAPINYEGGIDPFNVSGEGKSAEDEMISRLDAIRRLIELRRQGQPAFDDILDQLGVTKEQFEEKFGIAKSENLQITSLDWKKLESLLSGAFSQKE